MHARDPFRLAHSLVPTGQLIANTFPGSHSYERREIEAHLKVSDISPVTKSQMPHKLLVPNHQLRGQIQSWQESLAEVEAAGSKDPDEELILAVDVVGSNKGGGAAPGPVIEAVGLVGVHDGESEAGAAGGGGGDGVNGLVKRMSANFSLSGAAGKDR
jgi:hypothetical protein